MIARLRRIAATRRGKVMIAVAIGLALAVVLWLRGRFVRASDVPMPDPLAGAVMAPGVELAGVTGYMPPVNAAAMPAGGFDFAPNLAGIESEFDYAMDSLTDRLTGSAASMQEAITAANEKMQEQVQRQREQSQEQLDALREQIAAQVSDIQTTASKPGATAPPSGGGGKTAPAATSLPRWTPPAGIKVGDPTNIAGTTFAGRVKLTNGQYAPIIRYKSTGISQIHPEWQRWMKANGVKKA